MFVRRMTGFILVVGVLIAVGCSRGLPRLHPPAIDASSAGAKAVEMYDMNKDGSISGPELDKCPGLKAAVAQFDTSGKGAITAAMITARIKQWQAVKIGRVRLDCTVLRNGKPLADAEVKFVPESFLGDDIKAATGKTGASGRAGLTVPVTGPRDPPGAALGLYRVEITKAGDNIPAKYNSETTLGQEVALDLPALKEGIKFNLQY